jgi:hypothetical protein
MKWADVAAYVEALRALLRGETVDWEGPDIARELEAFMAVARTAVSA